MRARGMDPDDRNELLKQALDYLRVPDDCREDTSAWILDVARSFHERHEKAQQGAPRLSALRKQTGSIETHARELARLLDESDPYFVWAAHGYLGVDEWKDDQGVPHISEIVDPQKRAQLTAKLQRLASLAKRLHKALPKDTGGEHDLRGIFETPPTWLLAVDCWELFDWFRPGEATGHVAPTVQGGNYHTFVEIVYELAIEEKPTSGLTVFTKGAAPRCNAYAEQKPGYRRLRHARALGTSPVGLMTGSGFAANLYGAPNQLFDELLGRKRRR